MQAVQEAANIDHLLAVHKGHPPNYASVDCPICLASAAYHIQQEDKHAERCRDILAAVPLETINHAIAEVSTALDNPELVRPFAGGKLL